MAFKKPAVQTASSLRVVTLDNLGNAEKTKVGSVNFIPLFRVTKGDEHPGLSIDQIRDGIYPWFSYQIRKKGEEAGKVATVRVSWMDSQLRRGQDDASVDDPGVTLGLDLPAAQRKPIMGFGVPGLNFQDPNAYRKTVRVPVLWDVQPNQDREANADPKTGELVMLELKANQLENLVAQMVKVTKPGVKYTYIVGREEQNERYDYEGFGYVFNINKDTKRKMDTYEWSKTDMTTSEAHWRNQLAAAEKAFADYQANSIKVGRFYQDIITRCEEGELDFADAERMVVAAIAQRLLDAWGEPYGDTTDGILEAFDAVSANYSYVLGGGISQATTKVTKVDVDFAESEDQTEDTPF